MAKKIETPVASFADLIALGRKAYDDADRADKTRAALIDGLIAAGFTFANTAAYTGKALREGKVTNENKAMRDSLMFLGLATVKIKGRRLSDADLRKAVDDEVANKVMLAGTPKGTLNGVTTWRGNATSYISKIRADLEAREAAGNDKAGNTRTAKSDLDFVRDHLQTAYNRTFKADVAIKCDLDEVQRTMRDVAKVLGFTLKQPTK